MGAVVLLGTLDTKGAEYAFLRDRLLERGVEVLLVDAGINEPVGVQPDVGRDEVACAGGAPPTTAIATAATVRATSARRVTRRAPR